MKKTLIFIFMIFMPVLSFCQDKNKQQIVEKKKNGKVNWTGQYIEATGKSYIDRKKWTLPGQAEDMAERGAVVVAQRNLLEILQGVHITGKTTVKDKVTQGDLVISQVEGVVKGAKQYGEPVVTDNYVEITLRMPLYGRGGLAPIVHDKEERKQKPVINPDEESEPADEDTQLALKVDGKDYNPEMFPKFVDEDGNLLLDLAQYYDPSKGEFPKYMKLGKDFLKAGNNKKGVEIIDAVQDAGGNLKINANDAPKLKKWANTLSKIGKVAMTVLAFI